MLTLQVKEGHEFFDEIEEVFITAKALTVRLEHSLISISRWEAEYHRPYFPSGGHKGINTYGEELYYIKCMAIHDVPDYIPQLLYLEYAAEIRAYISNPHSATKVYRIGEESTIVSKTVTAELMYYWMTRFNIPPEYNKWHFNNLLALIDICNAKEAEANGKDKMSFMEGAQHRHELNKRRRLEYASS